MSTTSNMGLTLINSSDLVSPDPINSNFTAVDVLGKDYVTSSGTSGSWWYRKWKSGRAECGIDNRSFGSVSASIVYGNNTGLYCSKDLTFGSYPFTFASVPMVYIAPRTWSGISSVGYYLLHLVAAGSSVSTSPTWRILTNVSGTFSNLYAGIYVCGKVSS